MTNKTSTSTVKNVGLAVVLGLGVLVTLLLTPKLFENNDAGYVQVIQRPMSGELEVRLEPGLYWQGFSTVTTYQVSDMYFFSTLEVDGGAADTTDAISVQFNDGSKAKVSGSVKFRLPADPNKLLRLHREFKTFAAVKDTMIRQVVSEAIMQTANLMKAEESYSSRRSEFASLAEEMVEQGIFETVSKEVKEKDADGNEFIIREVNVKLGENGKPVIRKESPLAAYGVEIIQFVIKEIDFDDTIDALIAKKKEAEQEKIVAKAKAERAKQDAITAKEQGAADVAKAKAAEEVEKIKAVTQAQKEFEVSQFARKQAEEEAKAKIVQGEAEARVAKQKVQAGLTPLERANIEKDTAIGVAQALSQRPVPQIVMMGGGNNGNGSNAMEALGLNAMLEVQKKLAPTLQEKNNVD